MEADLPICHHINIWFIRRAAAADWRCVIAGSDHKHGALTFVDNPSFPVWCHSAETPLASSRNPLSKFPTSLGALSDFQESKSHHPWPRRVPRFLIFTKILAGSVATITWRTRREIAQWLRRPSFWKDYAQKLATQFSVRLLQIQRAKKRLC